MTVCRHGTAACATAITEPYYWETKHLQAPLLRRIAADIRGELQDAHVEHGVRQPRAGFHANTLCNDIRHQFEAG